MIETVFPLTVLRIGNIICQLWNLQNCILLNSDVLSWLPLKPMGVLAKQVLMAQSRAPFAPFLFTLYGPTLDQKTLWSSLGEARKSNLLNSFIKSAIYSLLLHDNAARHLCWLIGPPLLGITPLTPCLPLSSKLLPGDQLDSNPCISLSTEAVILYPLYTGCTRLALYFLSQQCLLVWGMWFSFMRVRTAGVDLERGIWDWANWDLYMDHHDTKINVQICLYKIHILSPIVHSIYNLNSSLPKGEL